MLASEFDRYRARVKLEILGFCSGVGLAMPVLRKESDIFPENLFDISPAEAPWQIAHLRSRQEKAVARLLLRDCKPFYLPQIERRTSRAGRTFLSYLPLFPGYVFLRDVQSLRETLWRTNALVRIIEVADQERLAAELEQIRRLQATGAILAPSPDLVVGDAVRITEGPFRGYVGVVIEERGSSRLVVSVSILRKSVTVEFPRDVVTAAKRTAAIHGRANGITA